MVYVERRVVDDATLSQDETFGSIRDQLCTFREGQCPLPCMLFTVTARTQPSVEQICFCCCVFTGYDDISDCIDLIICLGGDGTLLYASSLFQVAVCRTLLYGVDGWKLNIFSSQPFQTFSPFFFFFQTFKTLKKYTFFFQPLQNFL